MAEATHAKPLDEGAKMGAPSKSAWKPRRLAIIRTAGKFRSGFNSQTLPTTKSSEDLSVTDEQSVGETLQTLAFQSSQLNPKPISGTTITGTTTQPNTPSGTFRETRVHSHKTSVVKPNRSANVLVNAQCASEPAFQRSGVSGIPLQRQHSVAASSNSADMEVTALRSRRLAAASSNSADMEVKPLRPRSSSAAPGNSVNMDITPLRPRSSTAATSNSVNMKVTPLRPRNSAAAPRNSETREVTPLRPRRSSFSGVTSEFCVSMSETTNRRPHFTPKSHQVNGHSGQQSVTAMDPFSQSVTSADISSWLMTSVHPFSKSWTQEPRHSSLPIAPTLRFKRSGTHYASPNSLNSAHQSPGSAVSSNSPTPSMTMDHFSSRSLSLDSRSAISTNHDNQSRMSNSQSDVTSAHHFSQSDASTHSSQSDTSTFRTTLAATRPTSTPGTASRRTMKPDKRNSELPITYNAHASPPMTFTSGPTQRTASRRTVMPDKRHNGLPKPDTYNIHDEQMMYTTNCTFPERIPHPPSGLPRSSRNSSVSGRTRRISGMREAAGRRLSLSGTSSSSSATSIFYMEMPGSVRHQ
ncbi:serine-rich adhesin for platelets-like [Patella vulgata]|uniref:serine-rich adhesin for platelets-like n=1 Tax=Patella vulgata TaxID=6465 RepID=UPI0024A88ED5|nr:serine-rich adhesin for platelets-like [Patella vulgata]